MRCASAATACFCQCAGRQPSGSGSADSLLVVQSLPSLKALRAALQPICDDSLTGGSQTVLKRCKCVTGQNKLLSNNKGNHNCICSDEKSSFFLFYVGYNAIWNPEEGSLTRFLQCKSCLCQSSVPAAVVAAEVQYPSDTTRDQVKFM